MTLISRQAEQAHEAFGRASGRLAWATGLNKTARKRASSICLLCVLCASVAQVGCKYSLLTIDMGKQEAASREQATGNGEEAADKDTATPGHTKGVEEMVKEGLDR